MALIATALPGNFLRNGAYTSEVVDQLIRSEYTSLMLLLQIYTVRSNANALHDFQVKAFARLYEY
jgi:hypothetical protein